MNAYTHTESPARNPEEQGSPANPGREATTNHPKDGIIEHLFCHLFSKDGYPLKFISRHHASCNDNIIYVAFHYVKF
jgi:hypothetical protein